MQKNKNEKVKVASLTKIMTTILALENIDNIKEEIQMPKEAFIGLDGYVVSGIKPNEQITYEDLLYGTMLPSAADCANALAINISGSIDNFVEQMNKKDVLNGQHGNGGSLWKLQLVPDVENYLIISVDREYVRYV